MKFIHLSDLHIGKKVNEFSMLDEQEFILKEIINIINMEKTDFVIIAGDIYDKSVPVIEAVTLFDDFLVDLANLNIPVYIISGNHDSPERLSFGNRLLKSRNIFISSVYNGNILPYTLNDKFGKINIYMLPFIKPIHVKKFFPKEKIENYNDAFKTVINNININKSERNILIAHQFVTGSSASGGEELFVGGLENIDADILSDFDYVALGHIHKSQICGNKEQIRYCGSPLKYSFSEVNDMKSVISVNISEKNNLEIKNITLTPKTDWYEIKGSYEEITLKSFYENKKFKNSFLHIILTDEDDIPNAVNLLRLIYPNLMKLSYDNKRTRENSVFTAVENIKNKSSLTLFNELYEMQNNQPMSDEQKDFIQNLIDDIWEEK